ncbi:hypothetical protein NQ317_011977 [Molorchus minor]|uniref:Integrator complex subunit 5 C-terminal domain-containing protein n=1 Tax=Molorchus minor TaxID=1323400 RepID=A0ABQ9J920_9CUCU|nr:hypothetical protein NQ317_011977 [Molorchus minor]
MFWIFEELYWKCLWSLRETFDDTDAVRLQKKATVPYSATGVFVNYSLSAISMDIKNILNVDIMARLYHFIDDWCKYFGTPEVLEDDGTSNKIKGFQKVNRILKCLCTYSKVAKVLALRELLERALFRSDNILFGAVNTEHDDDCDKVLLKQNKKIS